MQNQAASDMTSQTDENAIDVSEKKMVKSCLLSWGISASIILASFFFTAFLNDLIILIIYLSVAGSCLIIRFVRFSQVMNEFNQFISNNPLPLGDFRSSHRPEVQIDTENDEELLWYGQQPTIVRAKIFADFYLLLWGCSFLPLLVVQILSASIVTVAQFFTGMNAFLFYLTIGMLSLYYFFITYAARWGAIKDKYFITSRKIRWEREEEWSEILLTDVVDFKVEKSSDDFPELNTGTISFKDRGNKKYWFDFEHIEQVDQVITLVREILPDLEEDYFSSEPSEEDHIPLEPLDLEISESITSRFSQNEKLLYSIKNVSKERIAKVHKVIFIGCAIFMVIYTPIFIINSTTFSIWGFFLLIIVPSITVGVALDHVSWMHKSREQFINISNKKIYLGKGYVKEIPFATLKALNYKPRGIRKGADFGHFTFITGKKRMEAYIIKDIPNAASNLRIIESVLYAFGNIEKRWQAAKKRLKYELPATIPISKEGLAFIPKRLRQLYRNLGIIIIVSSGVTLLLSLLLPPIGGTLEMIIVIQGLIIGFYLLIIIVVLYYYLLEIHLIHSRTALINEDSTLTLQANRIRFLGANFEKEIPLT